MVDVRLHLTHERRIEHIAQDDIAFALVLLHRTAPLRAPRRRHRQQRRKLSHEHILSITCSLEVVATDASCGEGERFGLGPRIACAFSDPVQRGKHMLRKRICEAKSLILTSQTAPKCTWSCTWS